MGKLVDLSGRVFGRLTVIRRANENDSCGKPLWVCECAGSDNAPCYRTVVVRGSHLSRGMVTSCGCYRKEFLSIPREDKPTKGRLEELYWDKSLPIIQIAKMFACGHTTISRWMKDYNIPTRTLSSALKMGTRKGRVKPPSREKDVRAKLSKASKLAWQSDASEKMRNGLKKAVKVAAKQKRVSSRVTLECLYCGGKFIRRKSEIRKGASFCSRECGYKGRAISKQRKREARAAQQQQQHEQEALARILGTNSLMK